MKQLNDSQKKRLVTSWLAARTREAYKPAFRKLKGNDRTLYKQMIRSWVRLENETEFEYDEKVDFDKINKIFNRCLNDNPVIFFVSSSKTISNGHTLKLMFSYNMTLQEIYDVCIAIEKALKKLKEQCSGKSFLEKELIVHNCIVRQVKYNNTDLFPIHSSHSIFVHQAAVCDGISKAAAIMYGYIGIDSVIVVGDADGKNGRERHAWNMIKVGDEFYHTDITFDNNKTNEGGCICYDYFNLTDEQISYDHYYNKKRFKAGREKIDYYTFNHLIFYDIESISAFFKQMLHKREKYIRFRYGDSVTQEQRDSVLDRISDDLSGIYSGTYQYYCILERGTFYIAIDPKNIRL